MPDQRAVLDGIPIKIQGSPGFNDPVEPVVIEHEPAGKNGARLQPMGLKAKRSSFTAFFKGESEWNNYLKLIKSIERQELMDFIHPKYGLMKGMVSLFVPQQNEIEHQASIAITFVEDIISQQRPVFREAVAPAAENHAVNVNDQAIAKSKSGIDDSLGEDGIGLADKIIDFNSDIIDEFDDITGPVRFYVKEVDRIVKAMEGTLAAVSNPVNSFINALDFGTSLPGRMVKAATQLAERVAILVEDFGTAPENFVNSYRDQMLIFEEAIGIDASTLGGTTTGSTLQKQHEISAKREMQENFKTIGATQAAVKLAEIYEEDDENRRQIQAQEQTESFDHKGNYLGASFNQQTIMTVKEIEDSLFVAREYIQEAIGLNRETPALHELALSLTRNVNEVKINLEQVVTVTLTETLPLFTVLNRYGLPYKMIDRIVALNEIPNPNEVTGEIKLYAAG